MTPIAPRNKFRTWLGVNLLTIGIVVLVGTLSYFGFTRLTEVRTNTHALRAACEVRNDQIRLLDEHLRLLNILIEARIRDRPTGTQTPADVTAAYDALRGFPPVPLTTCDKSNQ